MCRLFYRGGQPYVREEPKTKGKRNCRFAKRQKVAAMKAAGHFKGDNREFTFKGATI